VFFVSVMSSDRWMHARHANDADDLK